MVAFGFELARAARNKKATRAALRIFYKSAIALNGWLAEKSGGTGARQGSESVRAVLLAAVAARASRRYILGGVESEWRALGRITRACRTRMAAQSSRRLAGDQ